MVFLAHDDLGTLRGGIPTHDLRKLMVDFPCEDDDLGALMDDILW